jgi:hypothetical protein
MAAAAVLGRSQFGSHWDRIWRLAFIIGLKKAASIPGVWARVGPSRERDDVPLTLKDTVTQSVVGITAFAHRFTIFESK